MYKSRILEDQVRKINKGFKVLFVGGPRQVGKTTLLLHLAKKYKIRYVSLDDIGLRELARRDPELFLQEYPTPVLIDEVQYAPQLFPYIKLRVDRSSRFGQYWLTGSQQFSVMKNVQESLAGRVGIVSLLGFSSAEIRGEMTLKQPFLPGSQHTRVFQPMDVHDTFYQIYRGSFPALWRSDPPERGTFYNSYVQTYLDRDLRELFGVTKLSDFHIFLQLCAARTGQVLNYSELARDAGISHHAAREWMNILVSTMQVYLLAPYYRNVSKRLIKSPKLYFLDTGLAAYLTKWNSVEILRAGAMAGAFFETFVMGEIIKSYLFRGFEPPMYYFRDKDGHEVDLIIEQNQKLFPLEIKLTAQSGLSQLKNIFYLRKKIKNVDRGGIISVAPYRLSLDRENEIIPVSAIS